MPRSDSLSTVANKRARLAGLVAVALLWLLSLDRPALSQDKVTFDFDEPPETDIRISDSLSYGVEVELEGIHSGDFDLDRSREDDRSLLVPKLNLAFTYQPSETVRA